MKENLEILSLIEKYAERIWGLDESKRWLNSINNYFFRLTPMEMIIQGKGMAVLNHLKETLGINDDEIDEINIHISDIDFTDLDPDQISEFVKFHTLNQDGIRRIRNLNEQFLKLFLAISRHVPQCQDLQSAILSIRQAKMLLTNAISLDQRFQDSDDDESESE